VDFHSHSQHTTYCSEYYPHKRAYVLPNSSRRCTGVIVYSFNSNSHRGRHGDVHCVLTNTFVFAPSKSQ
jgi:hypothetical protein